MKGSSASNVTISDQLFVARNGSVGLGLMGRPSMISAKYRMKEERRKLLKVSIGKLKKIEDPESSLRRSVLINNTMKRLQKDARDEKLHKQLAYFHYPKQLSSEDGDILPSSSASDVSLVSQTTESFLKATGTVFTGADKENTSPFPHIVHSSKKNCVDFLKAEGALPKQICMEVTRNTACDETVGEVADGTQCSNAEINVRSKTEPGPELSRKRAFDEVDDCDMHDVLSQFYLPPTLRIHTSFDDHDDDHDDDEDEDDDDDEEEEEEEDVNVVDVDVIADSKNRICPQQDSIYHDTSYSAPSPPKCLRLDDKLDIGSEITVTSKGVASHPSHTSTVNIDRLLVGDLPTKEVLVQGTSVEHTSLMKARAHVDRLHESLQLTQRCVATTNDKPGLGPTFQQCSAQNTNASNIPNPSVVVEMTEQHQFSCGHSIFGELQSLVFHGLIASLES